nr:hypothetical protein [Pseudomonas mendocina]
MARTRAWRHSQAHKDAPQTLLRLPYQRLEKNWKLMYTRAEKLLRARQLGFSYPIRTTRQLLDQE